MSLVENTAGMTPDQKLMKEYQAKFEACARARRRYEQEWYTNIGFYFGKHYIQWVKTATGLSSNLIIPKAPAWRVRLVINRLKPVLRKEMAKIGKERPIFNVVPSTPDDEDITKARVAQAIADFQLNGSNFHFNRRQATFWASITGTGFIKTVPVGEDIKYYAPTPFHVWVPDLEEPDIQEQPFVVHGLSLSPDVIKAQYGVDLQPEQAGQDSNTKFLSAIGVDRKPDEIGDVFVKEFWVKPCPKFPQGAMFLYAQDQLLYMHEAPPEFEIDPTTGKPAVDPETEEPIEKAVVPSNIIGGSDPKSSYPFSHGRYPFAKIDHILTGRFYGESILVDMIPVQKEYNRSRSQVVEARNLTSKPQYVVPKGSVDVNKMTAQPGLIIEYTPGFDPPKPMQQSDIPAYVFQDQQSTVSDLDFIANQYEVTQGRTPPGIEAASAIAYLQEETDSILGPTIDSLEEAVEEIGYQTIELAREFWPEEKTLKVLSGSQVYEVFQFKRNSLPDQVDFRIERGSMQPRSSAAQRAFIMELINGAIIPPMEGLKYLEMSTTNRLYEDLQIDVRHAERENFKMKNGQDVMINEYDNNEVHAITHARFLKSQTFEALEETVKQKMIQHYMEHLQRIGRVELSNAGTDESGVSERQPSGAGTES